MPAPSHVLRQQVIEWIANNPDWSAERIRDRLIEVAESRGDSEEQIPSTRTIARYKRELSGADLGDYLYVRWPETFEAGLLPWESAAQVLYLRSEMEQVTVRTARWWWRVIQTAPEVPRVDAHLMSRILAVNEAAGEIPGFLARAIEWYLALRGWEDEDTYERRLKELNEPVERWGTLGLLVRAWPEGTSPAIVAEMQIESLREKRAGHAATGRRPSRRGDEVLTEVEDGEQA